MYNVRKSIVISDEDNGDMAITLIKPYSGQYANQLFEIYEDAYGEITGILKPISEIRSKFKGTDEEFEEILKQL